MYRELREFRRLERVCLEQAADSTMDLTRSGLLKVAGDCRAAAEAIEAQLPRWPLTGAVQALMSALGATQASPRH